MQALSPSPFYFFDEVDCALDSTAAGRVAAYVKAQCKRGMTCTVNAEVATVAPGAQTAASESGTSRCTAVGTAAQYLLVSHRPVVFESASCLLGVYSNGRGSSAAVVAHF